MSNTNDEVDIVPEYDTALAMFVGSVTAAPDAPMIRYFDTVLTWSEVDRHTDALAAALVEGGLRSGERVVLYLQNVPQYVLALVAAWKANAIAVSANPMLKARELRRILDDSGATVLICLEELYSQFGVEAVQGSTVQRIITTSERDFQTRNDSRLFAASAHTSPTDTEDLMSILSQYTGQQPPPALLTGSDTAVITYTSGTTGAPKGATNTHRNVVLGGQTYRDWFQLSSGEGILGIAPLFHVTGLSGHIAAAFSARMSLILTYRFESGVVLDAIREHRPTFTVGAITVFIALANDAQVSKEDLASLRTIASGGAPIPHSVVDEFFAKFGTYIHNAYGMTETTSPTHSVPLGAVAPTDPHSGVLSVGKPVYGTTVWVIDETGAEVGTGQIGEIVVAGARVVPGYWNKPDETAAAFDHGRLRTGDVGFVHDDGWLFLVDRKKDVIVASGYKVWPREVEEVLYSHPAVREAAVIGVPDEYRGESVKAFVTLKNDIPVLTDELIAFAKERLAAYKYPRSIEIVDALPMTATGKILRRDLRQDSGRPK